MTYIKLEDVQNALNDKFEGVELDYITWKINSLPSINPESMIEEMIEEHQYGAWDYFDWYLESLQELLNKLPK